MRPLRLAAALAALTLVLTGCGDQPARQASEGASPSPSPSPSALTDAEIDERLRKGFDTASKSDLRNLATSEETLLTDKNSYGTIAQIEANEQPVQVSDGVTLKVVSFDGAHGYCLSATHQFSENVWFYDSQQGGLLPAGASGCPATKGTMGDEKAGERLPADYLEKAREERREELIAEQELLEKARAQGPITEAERDEALPLVVEGVLGEGEGLIREVLELQRPVIEKDGASAAGPLLTLTELRASGAKLELPAGTSYEMTHLGETTGEFVEEGYCLEATHELLRAPVYFNSYGISSGPEDCPFPKVDGGQLRGLALTTQERERIEEQIEEYVLAERAFDLGRPEGPAEEPEEPEEAPDPLTDSLRNLAIVQETFLTDTNSYGSIEQLQSTESPGPYLTGSYLPAPGVTVSVVAFDEAQAFCLKAERDGVVRFYDSAAGGLLPDTATACTVTTKGTPGGSLKG